MRVLVFAAVSLVIGVFMLVKLQIEQVPSFEVYVESTLYS